MKSSGNKLIRLIALFKLLKSTLLIALGLSALHLVHRDVASVLQHWVAKLGLDPGNRYVERALQKFANLTPGKIKSLGAVSFIYAGLFLTEGMGLWLVKCWAEWFSVIITTSLVPVEIYEIHRHPTCGQVFATHPKYSGGGIPSLSNSQRKVCANSSRKKVEFHPLGSRLAPD
jgi:uncharacterized membrane protein (DUF2068 family)